MSNLDKEMAMLDVEKKKDDKTAAKPNKGEKKEVLTFYPISDEDIAKINAENAETAENVENADAVAKAKGKKKEKKLLKKKKKLEKKLKKINKKLFKFYD